jgi:hypothetical protein
VNGIHIVVTFKRRTYLLVMIALLMTAGVGLAQDQNLPDAPGVAVGSFPSAPTWSKSALATTTRAGGVPVDARAPWIDPRIADSAYWSATAALGGSTIANVELTVRCEAAGTCLTWLNGVKQSDRGRLYAYTLPSNVALDYLAYKMKGKTRFWILPQMAFTVANVFSAGRSYGRLQIDGWFAQKVTSSPKVPSANKR